MHVLLATDHGPFQAESPWSKSEVTDTPARHAFDQQRDLLGRAVQDSVRAGEQRGGAHRNGDGVGPGVMNCPSLKAPLTWAAGVWAAAGVLGRLLLSAPPDA